MIDILNRNYYLVMNPNLKEDCIYKNNIYNEFKANKFNLKEVKRIKDEDIYNYNKLFIDENSLHIVSPCINRVSGYIEHVRSYYKNYFIDRENKILILLKIKTCHNNLNC